jgi:hypothetical protein
MKIPDKYYDIVGITMVILAIALQIYIMIKY